MFVIINHSFDMQFYRIIFILVAIGSVAVDTDFGSVVGASAAADRPHDVHVDEYVDLVNVYFEHKHVSILTQFTCFSLSK